jgi:hypothetical protein
MSAIRNVRTGAFDATARLRASLCAASLYLNAVLDMLFAYARDVPSLRLGYFRCILGRTRTLDSHASRLRRKLNSCSDTSYVLNVWGVGYRLVASAG